MTRLILHISQKSFGDPLHSDHLRLFGIVESMAKRAGVDYEIAMRPKQLEAGLAFDPPSSFDSNDFHIVDYGSLRGSNILNAATHYIKPFWQIDPMGVRAFSSIAQKQYDPNWAHINEARPFFQKMRKKWVNARLSTYDQAPKWGDFPKNCLSVFYQGAYPRRVKATKFTDIEMLDIVRQGAGARTILVKPHPRVTDIHTIYQTLLRAEEDPRIMITDANIHSIIKASDVTVSINSTVALEGFMHKTPAILFGDADFHHFCGRVESAEQFKDVLAEELQRTQGFQQYFTWFFDHMGYDLSAQDIED